MISPFSVVKNTRESYSRFHQENFTEVEVQFNNENQLGYHSKPYWQYKSTCQIINSIVSGGDNYENHRRSHPKR